MISFLAGEEEGWLGGLRNLGFLGPQDFPTLVMLLKETLCIKSAVRVANGELGGGWARCGALRVVMLRLVLPGSGGGKERGLGRLLMG